MRREREKDKEREGFSLSVSFSFYFFFILLISLLEFKASGSFPGTPQRAGSNSGIKLTSSASSLKRTSKANQPSIQIFSKSDVAPVVIPRSSPRVELPPESKKDVGIERTASFSVQSRLTDFRKLTKNRDDSERITRLTGDKEADSEESATEILPPVSQIVMSSTKNPSEVRSLGIGRLGTNVEFNASNQSEDCMF